MPKTVKMNPTEKDRLCEILFLKYFENLPQETLSNPMFWECIKSICGTHKVDGIAVARAVRILSASENAPQDFEMWFLMNKLGMSVRQIYHFTGVYWQKQKECQAKLDAGTLPVIRKIVTDPVMKYNIKAFIQSIFEVFGSYKYLDFEKIEQIF